MSRHSTDPAPGGGPLPRITRSVAYLQYVRHADVRDFIQRGWIVKHGMADNHRSEYAVVMIFEGGDPA